MRINIPRYENGEKWWNLEDPGFTIDTDDYAVELTSVAEFINIVKTKMGIEKLEDYNEIVDDIMVSVNTKKNIKYYVDIFKNIKSRFNYIVNQMPIHVKQMYETKMEQLYVEMKRIIKINGLYIINNHNEIINCINEIRYELTNKLKKAKADANKKYYEKQKELINSVPKQTKTAEEIKKAKADANKKYYEKQKELINSVPKQTKTAEEIKKAKADANKKYYEKQKELINSVPKQTKTAEEIKKAKADANKKYYEKQKELLNSVPKLKKTAEELKEAQIKANKKSYEKRKELLNIQPKIIRTEEEQKEARADANKKYYQSKKELLAKIQLLENQINN